MKRTYLALLTALIALTGCGDDLEARPWSIEEPAEEASAPSLSTLEGLTFMVDLEADGCVQEFLLLHLGEARAGEIDFEVAYVEEDACDPGAHGVWGCGGVALEVGPGELALGCTFESEPERETTLAGGVTSYSERVLFVDGRIEQSVGGWRPTEACEDEARLARNAPLAGWCAAR